MNIRKKLVEAGKRLYNTGLVAGTSGNISMRNLEKRTVILLLRAVYPIMKLKKKIL